MILACCDTWGEQSNACIVADACPGRTVVALSYVDPPDADEACPIGQWDCLVTAIPSCCLQDCSDDGARCALAPGPVPSCCGGYCGASNVEPTAKANLLCTETLETRAACCTRADGANAITLRGAAPAPIEWIVNFGDKAMAPENAGSPDIESVTDADVHSDTEMEPEQMDAPVQGGGCSVSGRTPRVSAAWLLVIALSCVATRTRRKDIIS